MDVLWATYGAFAVAYGLVIGSFLNVVIARLPEDRSLWPRSACPTCGHAIRPVDLVPVLSYVWLRGRCRDCGARVPPSYPLVELLGGLLAWLCWERFVPDAAHLDPAHGLAFLVYFGFLATLVAASFVDLRHHILPDETTIYAAPVGIVATALLGWAGYAGWPDVTWREAVLGAGLGGLFLGAVAVVAELVLRREGLGWGDVKLIAMVGAFLGLLPGAFLSLLVGALLGSVAGLLHLAWTRRRSYLPMGPFIAFGAALYLLYGDHLLRWLFPGIGLWTGKVDL